MDTSDDDGSDRNSTVSIEKSGETEEETETENLPTELLLRRSSDVSSRSAISMQQPMVDNSDTASVVEDRNSTVSIEMSEDTEEETETENLPTEPLLRRSSDVSSLSAISMQQPVFDNNDTASDAEAQRIELLPIVSASDVPHEDDANDVTVDDLISAFRTSPQIKVLELLNEILTRHDVSVCDIHDDHGNNLLHLAAERNFITVAETLLEHDLDILEENDKKQQALEVAMAGWNREYDPMVALILQHLDNVSVRELFSRSGQNPPRLNLHTLIKQKFEITVNAVLGSLADQSENGGMEVFYDILESDKEGHLPTDKEKTNRKTFTVFHRIALQGSIDLVNHDIVRLLTSGKWRTFAKRRFTIQALIYLFVVFSLTFVAVTSVTCNDVMTYDTPLQYARACFEVISYGCVCMLLMNELRQLYREKKNYFTDFVNIAELLASLVLVSVLPFRFLHTSLHWYVFAVGYLLWIHIIHKYAAIFRTTGIQAQILWKILNTDVVQFSILFLVINFAFSGSFLLVLKGDSGLNVNEDTSSFFSILLFGLRTLIEGESVLDYMEGYRTMSIIVILAFLFVTIVILLNILIAHLSDTYQKIAADADRNYEVNVARIIAWMEINDWACSNCKNVQNKFYCSSELIQDMNARLELRELTLLEEISQLTKLLVRKQTNNDLHILTVKSEVKRMQGSMTAIKTGQPTINQTLSEVRSNIDVVGMHVSELKTYPEMVQTSIYDLGQEIQMLQRTAERIVEEIKELRYGPSPSRDDYAMRYGDMLAMGMDESVAMAREAMLLAENIPDLEYYNRHETECMLLDEWLLYFTEKPQHQVLAYLNSEIRQGFKVGDYKFADGETPLHIAAKRGHYFVVEKLIDVNVDLFAKNGNGKMALEVALENEMDNIAALMITRTDKQEARELFLTFGKNTEPIIRLTDYFNEKFRLFVGAVLDCLVDQDTVYYDVLEADINGRVPSDEHFNQKETTSFQSLAHWGDKAIVNHVIVRILIQKKWFGYARRQFMFFFALYLMTVLSITFAAVLAVQADDVRYYNSTWDVARAIFEALCFVFVLLGFLIELREFKRNKLEHLRDPFNWLEGGSAVILIVLPLVRHTHVQAHWYMFAVGYFLWSVIIFKYAAIFRQTGAYAQILWHIIHKDIVQFSILFAVINLAFSGSFLLVLKGDDNLQTNNETSTFFGILFVGLRTMTEGEPVISYTGPDGYKSASVVMMLTFLFVTIVILLNILIAQLSDTYTKIQGDAERELEVRKARIISRIERTPLPCCRQRDITQSYVQSESTKDLSSTKGMKPGELEQIIKNINYVAEKQVTNQLNALALKDETIKCKTEVKDLTRTTRQQKEETSKVKNEVSNLERSVDVLRVELKDSHEHVTNQLQSFSKDFTDIATILNGVRDAVRTIPPPSHDMRYYR